MRRATIIVATMMMLCCTSAAFAVTPTATLTPTPLATPTPAPTCQDGLGNDGSGNTTWCDTATHSAAGNPFIGGGQYNGGNEQTATWGGAIFAGTNTSLTATCSGGSTGVAIASGSTNNRGSITTSSSASTNCTITWSSTTPWPVAPFCGFFDANASVTPLAYSVDNANCTTTSCKFDFASATSAKVNWLCM